MTIKFSALKAFIILWTLFAIFYIALNEWNGFKNHAMLDAYNQGLADAASKVLEQAKTCKPFPINVGGAKDTLVSVNCMRQSQPGQPEVQK